MTPQFGIAGMEQESIDPCLESLGIAQSRQITPGTQECLLHSVLGHRTAPDDPMG
jgi:hypothetical protein